MSVQPVSNATATSTRDTLARFLAISVATAMILIAGNSWLDSRKTPTIVFMATPTTQIALDVRGAISTPGVVYLDSGSRMVDAIDAAGGLAPDADRSLINLSARVSDGQMIMIPTQPSSGGVTSSGQININTASVEQLKQLPGIGDVLAQRIVAYREFNGPFQSPDDLIEVEGISSTLVEQLLPYVTVSDDE